MPKESPDGVARDRRSFRERLLVDLICDREEAAGHPEDSKDADDVAARKGGNISDRIFARAQVLPSGLSLQVAIQSVIGSSVVVATGLFILGALLGCVAAGTILAAQPVNLPLALSGLVALNLTFLIAWLLFSFSPLGWLAQKAFLRLIDNPLARHIGHIGKSVADSVAPQASDRNAAMSTGEVVRTLFAHGRNRWLIGCATNTIWLAFALCCSATLWVSLLFRSYSFSWETTLLSNGGLARVAHALSWPIAKLHLIDIQGLSVIDTTSALARQTWGWWLLWTTLIYGVVPRIVALGFCVARLWFSQRTIGRRFDRPGFARLRARLMPDSRTLAASDPDTERSRQAPNTQIVEVSLSGSVHGIGLDDAATKGPPPIDGVVWKWLGQVNDLTTETAASQRLRNENVSTLAIVVRATMTPDRGVERIMRELMDAARAPLVLVLDDIQVLDARGSLVGVAYREHWQALATRVGAIGMYFTWGSA